MPSSTLEPGDNHLPPEVIEAFDALCTAAQHQGSLALMTVKTSIGGHSHYVIGVMTGDRSRAIPIAIIPCGGLSVGEFLKYFDTMAVQMGGAESDPEFKGVRQ